MKTKKSLILALLLTSLSAAHLSALGEAAVRPGTFDEHAATWKIVAQNSEFYGTNEDYYFRNGDLRSQGCGPCSIANALIAVFDVT